MSKVILLDSIHENAVSIQQSNNVSMCEELGARLKTGISQFVFKKADGTHRNAFGTLDPKYLPVRTPEEIEAQASKAKPANELIQNYWDIEAQGWRAFIKNNLITIL